MYPRNLGTGSVDNDPVNTADVSVRPAVPEDAPEIARIQLAAWAHALGRAAVAGMDQEAVSEQWREAIAASDRRSRVLTALAGARAVGFAASTPARRTDGTSEGQQDWTVEIIALEIDAAHRRAGHGSRLVAATADLARERGGRRIAAWAMRTDEARLAFLTGAGLAEAGLARTLAIPGGEVEEILLTASLGARD